MSANVGDVIKEYLVSLGFNVDSDSFNSFTGTLDKAGHMVAKFASGTVGQFLLAGTAAITFIATVNAGLASLMRQLAQNDLEMDKWARAMFTTKENAVVLNNAIKAMGVSMQDLYLSPELLNQFNQLRQQSFQMLPPEEYANQMKFIRSLMFEFTRFKLEVTYALQWVGYYLFKYLEKPLQDMKLSFKSFNDVFTKNMPVWTEKVAMFLSWFVRLGAALWKVKEVIAVVIAAFAAPMVISALTNPITLLMAGLVALLLLIDDFSTWKRGGKSAFGDFWQSLQDSGILEAIDEISTAVGEMWEALKGVGIALGDLILQLSGTESLKEFADLLGNNIKNSLKSIADYIRAITDLLKGDFQKAWEHFGSGVERKGQGIFGGGLSIISELWDRMRGSQPYVTPQAYRGSTSTNQTNNFSIYGSSDPGAVAMAVANKIPTKIMTRNMQGVVS